MGGDLTRSPCVSVKKNLLDGIFIMILILSRMRKRIRSRLTSWKAALAYLVLIVVVLNQFIGTVSNIDFVLTASGNSRLVRLWHFFATPTGNLIAVILSVFWITVLAFWPRVHTNGDEASESVPSVLTSSVSTSLQTDLLPAEGRDAAKKANVDAKANLICKRISYLPAHNLEGILREGHLPYNHELNVVVIVAEISNDFDPTRKVADLRNVSAEIFYESTSGNKIKVSRGSWLSEGSYHIDLNVNDTERLIIVFFFEDYNHVFFFEREWTGDNSIENRTRKLEGDLIDIKVRIINESSGTVFKEFDFRLTVVREPEFDVILTESIQGERDKQLALMQRLNIFIEEGNQILNKIDGADGSIKDLQEWESKVENWLKFNLGDLYALEFKKNTGFKPYPRPAINRQLVDKLYTRIERLGEIMVEVRRN